MVTRLVSLFRSFKRQGTFLVASATTSWVILPLIHVVERKVSDRALKENFTAINSTEILEMVSKLPVSRWTYKGEPNVWHLGPTAQNFRKAFGLGDNKDTYIWSSDLVSVALTAIQAQQQQIQTLQAEIRALRPTSTEPC